MTILTYMGNTPLVKLKNPYGEDKGNVYLKIEEFNPGGSIKSRVGLNMIEDAEKIGLIKKGDTLLEPTGGNTGLGLAIAAGIKGYKIILTIPDNFSKFKIETLKSYGVEIILADHLIGNDCHIQKATELLLENPDFKCLNQFENYSNPAAHYKYTGKEILAKMNKEIDCFVSVIGSGGTITGVATRLKEELPNIDIVGVQPEGCDILNNIYVPHKIQTTAVGKVGTFFKASLIDKMVSINFDDVQAVRQYLAKEQGLFVGISAGANVLAAFLESQNYQSNQNIVTIAPDGGGSYQDI